MRGIKKGSRILDMEMSKHYGRPVIAEVLAVENGEMVCVNLKLPCHYPHNFYDFERGKKWTDIYEISELAINPDM